MDPESPVQRVFAEAIEVPPGEKRAEFVVRRCGKNVALLGEVQSLLRAHEAAGTFLRAGSSQSTALCASGTSPAQSGQTQTAAACAGVFLEGCTGATAERVSDYVAGLPKGIQQEARERIQAGLRVRQLCGTRAHSETVTAEMPRLPGFRIEGQVGQGGLGVVYAAHDEKLNRRVAIKVLRRSSDAQVRHRVLEEARRAAALGDPAVVTIYSVLDECEEPAIVMEFIEGFELDRFAAQLNFEQKARLLREVARGLSVAHQRGLIHRDLKPDNVLVGPDLRPRILDFGLALSLEEAIREGRGFEGTALYASPEQAMGGPLGPASDVFSFGSLMFKVLTGTAPFGGGSVKEVLDAIVTTAPPFLREVAVGVPDGLQAICLACLAWRPSDRPSAEEVALELGRFLVGEPVQLKPKLYDDLLRRTISEHENQATLWEQQSIISRDERDALEVIHRRLLADEDHWIIDARRITPLQTILSAATWLTVVATVLTVWMLHDELTTPWRWCLPVLFATALLTSGYFARLAKQTLAAATFLAGAALAIAPATLALLAELSVLAIIPVGVVQLFDGTFTNHQVLTASITALGVSVFGLWRLKMTGFAWTTATLAATSYLSVLLQFNWLEQEPEVMALWCLPLAALEVVALGFERVGRVRWTLPFHLIAMGAIVVGLDVMALNGPTLHMLGVMEDRWSYFNPDRQAGYSLFLNGVAFLGLMAMAERSRSLDLRRAAKWLEVLALVHVLSALFGNALQHRDDPLVRYDVWMYLTAATLFAALAPLGSRWRMLVGGLVGSGLGSYLLVDLEIVPRKPFIIGLGVMGLAVALGAFGYVLCRTRSLRQVGRIKAQPIVYSSRDRRK